MGGNRHYLHIRHGLSFELMLYYSCVVVSVLRRLGPGGVEWVSWCSVAWVTVRGASGSELLWGAVDVSYLHIRHGLSFELILLCL
jgi:hypothetical protein